MASPMSVHVLRLMPGDDVAAALDAAVARLRLRAAFVLTAVGSLRAATLRFANAPSPTPLAPHAPGGTWEVLGLVGTLSRDGCHVHATLGDGGGCVVGGHVSAGCVVYTTLELVLGEAEGVAFTRPVCGVSGWDELVVTRRGAEEGDARSAAPGEAAAAAAAVGEEV